MADEVYRPDLSLKGKLRRRLVRLYGRRPARTRPGRAMISFAFDDAPASALRAGAAILEQSGSRGTYFISAGLAGRSGHLGDYATPEDVQRAFRAGHEIGCHTYSHLDCAQADATEVDADLDRNLDAFSAWNLPAPSTFAYPFGDVSAPAKRILAKRFALSRALHPGLIGRGCDLNQAPAIGIEGPNGETRARRWMARARIREAWLILFTHGVEAEVTGFGASEQTLARLVGDAIRLDFDIVTVAEGARRVGAAS